MTSSDDERERVFPGESEMARRLRAVDWSETPLGPVSGWSPTLRTMISFLLASRFPMLLWWGPEYVQLYNDAYIPVPGAKHPRAGGQRASECWPEIWEVIGPLIDVPFRGGPATWMDDLELEVHRHGFTEETHFTVAYSPVPDAAADGGIGGVLATVHEITQQVLQERRVRMLRDLGTRALGARSADEACALAADVIRANPRDVPFAAIYLLDDARTTARLVAAAGVTPGAPCAPRAVSLHDAPDGWPFAEAIASEEPVLVHELATRFKAVPPGPWQDAPRRAVVLPIPSAQNRPSGVLVLGVSARLALDELHRSFLHLVTGQVATAVANARSYEQERERAEALAELDRAKTDFFSNVSHEFRTPLTLMLGPLEDALGSPGLPPPQRDSLDVAHRNGLRLLRLVNTLLDFSRIEAGRADATYEEVDVATLTGDLASVFRSATERAGLSLDVRCDAPRERPVFVDRDMWEKIVLNLLSNAFKFTLEGGIAVSCGERDGEFELVVEDTGVGIPQAELPHVFERFHRVRGSAGRTHEGTGIGLALVSELVKLHGGEVAAESELGRGSRFSVRIPTGAAHLPPDRVGARRHLASTAIGAAPFVEEALRWLPETDADAGTEIADDGGLSSVTTAGARVLVADDNADMRDYLARILRRHFEVELVADGEAALGAARARRPDLVLSDVMMPRLDGIALTRALRSDAELRSVPILLLSARAGEESRLEGVESGADDYLTKPFSARELVTRVNANLQLARVREEALGQQERLSDELRAKSAELQAVLETAPVSIWFARDPQARVIEGNRAASALSSVARGENAPAGPGAGRGATATSRRTGAALRRSELPLQRAVLSNAPVLEEEIDVELPDGETRTIVATAVPLTDGAGAVRGGVAAAVDVTERRRAEAVTVAQKEALELAVGGAPIAAVLDRLLRAAEARAGPGSRAAILTEPAESRVGEAPALDVAGARWRFPIVSSGSRALGTLAVFHGQPREPGPRDVESMELLARTAALLLERHDAAEERRRAEEATRRSEGQLEAANAELRERAERFRSLISVLTDVPWTTDAAGEFAAPQDAWAAYTGQSWEQSRGFGWLDALHPEDRAAVQRKWSQAYRTGTLYEAAARMWNARRGEYRHVVARAAPLRYADGSVREWVGSSTDVHEAASKEEALRAADDERERLLAVAERARADAEKANRAKDEFLAVLSHELRSPLNAMLGWIPILKRAASPDDLVDRAVQTLERNIWTQAQVINDLLDVSRIASGKLELESTRVDLAAVVAGAVESMQPMALAKRVGLGLTLSRERLEVDGDPARLQQIVGNVLHNALKFTPEGGRVAVRVHDRDHQVVVEVEDTGVGIEPELLPHVFDRFVQSESSTTRRHGGLGLGLAIVKQLTALHGGTVHAESAGVGRGATFHVRLPLAAPLARALVAAAPVAPRARRDGHPLDVLIVEDDPDSRDALGMALEEHGVRVRLAGSVRQALEKYEVQPPDMLLSDIGMPGEDGYALIRAIREREEGTTRRTLAIAMTGFATVQDRERALRAGFDEHVGKPVAPGALLERVRVLSQSRGAR